jgi:hypothetical protein
MGPMSNGSTEGGDSLARYHEIGRRSEEVGRGRVVGGCEVV